MVKVRCINKVGYNDIKLKRFVDYNDEIEVDEERAKYLVDARGLCERVLEDDINDAQDDKQEESKDNESDNKPEETKENKKDKK